MSQPSGDVGWALIPLAGTVAVVHCALVIIDTHRGEIWIKNRLPLLDTNINWSKIIVIMPVLGMIQEGNA